jgi:hypothetical protein
MFSFHQDEKKETGNDKTDGTGKKDTDGSSAGDKNPFPSKPFQKDGEPSEKRSSQNR